MKNATIYLIALLCFAAGMLFELGVITFNLLTKGKP